MSDDRDRRREGRSRPVCFQQKGTTILDDASAIIYRHRSGGLPTRVAFFGGVGGVMIALALILLLTGPEFAALKAAPCLIIGLASLGGLFVVARAERRGRPCLILQEDSVTFEGYLSTKQARWSELGVFTMHVRQQATSPSDDPPSANVEPTQTLQAWILRGSPGRLHRKKPDFVIEDYYDLSLGELRVILNRRVEAARG